MTVTVKSDVWTVVWGGRVWLSACCWFCSIMFLCPLCCCRCKIWLFTWRRRFWRTQPFQEMKTLGPSPRSSAHSEKVRDGHLCCDHCGLCVRCLNGSLRGCFRSWRHLKPRWLHHLPRGRRDSAVCILALPGNPIPAAVTQRERNSVIFWNGTHLFVYLQESVPPVMAFHLGSLGFLTPFKFDTYKSQVTQIIEGTECCFSFTLCVCKISQTPHLCCCVTFSVSQYHVRILLS